MTPPYRDKTVLVTGASGLLGRPILQAFEEAGWHAVGTGLSRSDPPRIRKLDITDFPTFEALINEISPIVIVHSAAEKRHDAFQDPAKQEQANRLNVQVPEFLGNITKERGILLIYISTDNVFDGKNPPYYPDSKTNPLNLYGLSKLKGEQVVMSTNPQSTIILRVPILYGEGRNDESAVNCLLDPVLNEAQNPKSEMDNVAIRFPTATSDVAHVILNISKKYLSNPEAFHFPEILHFSAPVPMTKYEMALKFGEILGVPTDHLVKVDKIDERVAVQRPENAQLDVGRLRELGIGVETVDFTAWWRRYLGAYRH